MIAFGLNLAGYSTGKSALAAVMIHDAVATATLLRSSSFSTKRNGTHSASDAIEADATTLRRCLLIGPVAVDIPIDLQGLPDDALATAIWGLTKRPVDQALNAMPPLADRIGAPVARFRRVMKVEGFQEQLGTRLFEAYPAQTLKRAKLPSTAYKGLKGALRLKDLCTALRFDRHLESDDDLDAIICAVAAASPDDALLTAQELGVEGPLPRGYRIPKRITFDRIELREAQFEAWIGANG